MKILIEALLGIAFFISITNYLMVSNGIVDARRRMYNGLMFLTMSTYMITIPSQKYIMGVVLLISFWAIVLIMNIKAWKSHISTTSISKDLQTYYIHTIEGKSPLPSKKIERVEVNFLQKKITLIPNTYDIDAGEKVQTITDPKQFKKIVRYLQGISA